MSRTRGVAAFVFFALFLSLNGFCAITASPPLNEIMNLDDQILEPQRALMRQGKLKEAEKQLLPIAEDKSLPRGARASALVYLGSIRDRQADRDGAMKFYREAQALGEESGLAAYGLKKPLLFIRHIDRPGPSLALTPEQMRENLDFACREIPKYYQAMEQKGIHWDDICAGYSERLKSVSSAEGFYLLLFRLAAELKDSHTYYVKFPYRYLAYGVGASCRCDADGRHAYVAAVEKNSPAERAGLPLNAEILSVDGKPLDRQIKAVSPWLPGASSERIHLLETCLKLFQENRFTAAAISYCDPHGGRQKTVTIARGRGSPPRPLPPSPSGQVEKKNLAYARLPDDLGWIRFLSFQDNTGEGFREYQEAVSNLKGVRGLVFDLRGNNGGSSAMPNAIIRTLIKTRMLAVKYRIHRLDGQWENRSESQDPDVQMHIDVPVVAITDETTQSAAELFATMLAYIGVRRVGSATGGMLGGFNYELGLPCGLHLHIEYGSVFLPDGRSVEGSGVPVDKEIVVSREDRITGRDPVLDAAIAYLRRMPAR